MYATLKLKSAEGEKNYELPSGRDIQNNWPNDDYQKLHKAFCDLFNIAVPDNFRVYSK